MPKEICMLAHPYNPKRVIFPAYIQPKIDGIRAIWKHKEKRFVSRNNKPLIVSEIIIDYLVDAPFDIDGELIIPGKTFNEISGIVRHLDMIPEKYYVHYTMFDIICESSSFAERILALKNFQGSSKISYTSVVSTIKIEDFWVLESTHKINLQNGYEGSIIRNNTPYEFKRSYNLLKLKPTKEIICKIINRIEGTGKYEGMLGALTVETSDKKIFNVGSGFTDEERSYLWENSTRIYNTFIKVKYQDLSEYGIPRFPIFKSFKKWE